MKGTRKKTGLEQEKGPKSLETTVEPQDHTLRGRTVNSGSPQVSTSPGRQGRALSPLGKLQAQDVSTPWSCQWFPPLAHQRPGWAHQGPTCATCTAPGKGDCGPGGSLSIPTARHSRPWPGEAALEKAAARQAPRAQAPGRLSRISRRSLASPAASPNLARPLHPQEEYLQPSDPGWEQLGKAHQPLATAVQQLPEAAAGSGAQGLGGHPAAAALDWARAPQRRAQQQPQRRRGRAEARRAHCGPAACRSALRSAAGAHSEPGTNFQPTVDVRAAGRVCAPSSRAPR